MTSTISQTFDQTNFNWSPTPEYNQMFIKNMEKHMNHILQSRGHLFLNEVYMELGLKHTSAGALGGWLSKGPGPDFVEIKIVKERKDGSLLLTFNSHDVIYDKIEE